MKKLTSFFYTCMIASVLLTIVSCKKDKDDDAKPANETSGVHSTLPVANDNNISKKWTVESSSAQSRTTGQSNAFYSFEFTPYGYYLIVDEDSTIYSDTYIYDDVKKTITLTNYGTITFSSITASDFNFSVYVTELDVTYDVTTKATALLGDVSNSTLQLARSWKLTSQTRNGESTGILSTIPEAFVIISKYGTHAVIFKGGLFSGLSFSEVWAWKDNTHTQVCVGDVTPDCTHPLNIYLSSDNKMIAKYNDGDGDMVEEYEAISK